MGLQNTVCSTGNGNTKELSRVHMNALELAVYKGATESVGEDCVRTEITIVD